MEKKVNHHRIGLVHWISVLLTLLAGQPIWASTPSGLRSTSTYAHPPEIEQRYKSVHQQLRTLLASEVGSIAGTVTDEKGNPLSPVAVALYSYVTDNTGKSSWVRQYTDGTHADGVYKLTGVKPGKYRIRFSYSGAPRTYGAVYYKDAAIIEGAQDVTIESGVEVRNIDAMLAHTGSIAGQVTDRLGQPLAGIKVNAYRYAKDNNNQVLWPRAEKIFTDATGAYALTYLDAGRYRLFFEYPQWPPRFLSAYYTDATTINAATDITVTPSAVVTGINAHLDRTGTITGTVTDGANRPLMGIRVIAYQNRLDKAGKAQYYYYEEAKTNANGLYNLENLPPDNYTLDFLDSVKPLRYQPEYYDNTFDLSKATTLVMERNATLSRVNAKLAPYGSSGNTAPVAVNDEFAYITRSEAGTPIIITGNVLVNDVDPDDDPMTIELVTGPLYGVLDLQPNGAFQYQPNDSSVITDTFAYLIHDSVHESNIATVTLSIVPADAVTELFLPMIMR